MPKIDEKNMSNTTRSHRYEKKSERASSSNNLYGTWYDVWGKDASVDKRVK
jgi:hypothetical protein